jgi:signal transduction histidine kinase
MPNQASHRIERLKDQIMKVWEERALKEVLAATHQETLALHDSLPEFLSQISTALSTTINRTDARVRFDREESTRIGKKHGRERAGSLNYTMDQLIFEYHILRQVIIDEMEKEAPLTDIEREVIICAVEQAVNDAATQFSETLADIQKTFTHTLAHDLRGPISTTKLSAQLILKKANDVNTCISLAGRISTVMDRLDGMISDLLDAGKLKAGAHLTIKTAEIDLEETLSFVVEDKNFLHENRVKFDSPGPVRGNWDEKGMERVFENLLANALKYSPPGSKVDVELKKSKDQVIVKIKNSGNPIPENELGILFQQYRRSRKTDEKVGWGLGLTVVKGITEAHKGKVEVSSTGSEGTVFTVTLPMNSAV